MKKLVKKIRVRKLYNGCASIRDYNVMECIEDGKKMVINYKHFTMTVPHNKLNDFFQFHDKKFSSRFDKKKYKLKDIKFIPDWSNNGISSIQ